MLTVKVSDEHYSLLLRRKKSTEREFNQICFYKKTFVRNKFLLTGLDGKLETIVTIVGGLTARQ
jgi:hypothetical protein